MLRKNILLAAILAFSTALVYIPSYRAGFIWDDDAYLTENKTLTAPDGLMRTWFSFSANPQYYPMVFTTFRLERSLWGLEPRNYHIVNVALHILSALALWRILVMLGLPGAWLAAAVFALHPMNVESVAWITERKNVLSGFFYFCSAYCLLRFFGFGASGKKRPPSFWYAASITLFAAALLSKTVTAVLPAAFVAILWWKREKLLKSDWMSLAPFFAMAAALGSLTVWVERTHVGASGGDWDISFPARVAVAGKALWFYMGKILVPMNLSFIYPRFSTDVNLTALLFPLAFLVLLAAFFGLRKRTGKGPLAAMAYFSMALFPALGFFNVFPHRYSFVADHFAYHALPGFIALVICGAAACWDRLGKQPCAASSVAALLALAPLFAATACHGGAFKDAKTLWTRTLETNPAAWMAHNNLSVILDKEGRPEEALAHLKASLALRPDLPEVHYNLAGYYSDKGDKKEAARHLEQALSLETSSDDVNFQLGMLLVEKGRKQEALVRFLKAAKANPKRADAFFRAGELLAEAGDRRALFYFQKALAAKPGMPEAQNGIGRMLVEKGDAAGAESRFRAALKSLPNDPVLHNELGAALALQGKDEEALAHFGRAVALDSRNAEALTNMALLLAKLGRNGESLERYQQALKVEEKNPETNYNVGVLLIAQGRRGEALGHFARAVELAPDFPQARFALGRELAILGRYQEAGPNFKAAVELAPDFAPAREEYVKFLWINGKTAEARREFAELQKIPGAGTSGLARWLEKTRPGRPEN